jgi:hypothetical protein
LQQQDAQNETLPITPYRQRPTGIGNLERTEDPDLHAIKPTDRIWEWKELPAEGGLLPICNRQVQSSGVKEVHMRKVLLATMAATLLVTMLGGPATASGVRSVNGGSVGQTLVEDPFDFGLPIGFYGPISGSFSVVELPNGEVHGHVYGKPLGGPHDFKADAVCVSFDGNQAWIGLELRESPWPFPDQFGIWVEDNGQGERGAPDRISSASFIMEFYGTAQEWCDLQTTNLMVWEIDNGGIRVNS